MKKIVFFLVVFIVFVSGCRTLQPTTPVAKTGISDVKSDIKTNTEVDKKSDINENMKLKSDSTIESNKKTESKEVKNKTKETTVTDFDTNKPINQNTGKPPVLRETKTTEREITESDLKILESSIAELKVQIANNKELVQTTDSQRNEITRLKSEIQTKEIYGLKWWQKALMICGVIFLVLFLIAVYRKIKPFIKI